jgi:phosphoribosyl 1,2-cyclic phosphodiesterase/CheY-like chemotaxis protein
MRVRFWGTRGSIPKPGPDTLRYGGNTSCVELQSEDGTRIILDCGSGAQDLGLALQAVGTGPIRGHLLISHTHWDHIQGLPFFAPLSVPGNEWDIYGPHGFCHSLRDALAGQMQYTYFPVGLQHFGATTRYHDLVEGTFRLGEIDIQAQYLNHPALTLGYRFKIDGVVIVYACDHEPYSRQLATGQGEIAGRDRVHADFLADADLVIHDAQYTAAEYPAKVGWGHSTVDYAVRLCRYAGARRLAITHHDPLRRDAALDRIIENIRAGQGNAALEVFAAAEGQVTDLSRAQARRTRRASPDGPATPPLPAALRNHSVILVASNPTVAKLISVAVETDGVRVVRASDGPSVTRLLNSEQASLVVLEHQPPRTDALETCRAIRSLDGPPGEVPVVLVAAEEDRALRADADVTDWLVTPFSEVYARTKLHAWLMRAACRWQRAPTPRDEGQRLAALQKLRILDTPPEDRFDRIGRLAAALFEVPIVLVSLVDRDRQWFKSCLGIPETETSRELSFCAHAILGEDTMVVPDTLRDERFADNPLVTGEPRIRFYAGYPLVLEGMRIGTLCLVDTRPRQFDETKINLLQDLGRLVEQELRRPSDQAPVTGARPGK